MLPHFHCSDSQHQIAGAVDTSLARSLEGHADLVRIGARRDNPVVFNGPPACMEHQIDARINLLVTDRSILGDIVTPLGGVASP